MPDANNAVHRAGKMDSYDLQGLGVTQTNQRTYQGVVSIFASEVEEIKDPPFVSRVPVVNPVRFQFMICCGISFQDTSTGGYAWTTS